MDVLFIPYSTNARYGANKSLLPLVKYLKKSFGVNPFFLLRAKGEMVKTLNSLNIPYLITPHSSFVSHKTSSPTYKFYKKTKGKLQRINVYKKVRNWKTDFDLIHSNSGVTDIGYFISKQFNIKHVWHLREFIQEDYDLEYLYSQNKIKKIFTSNVGKYIANSIAIKNKFRSQIKSKNIEVIYNPIEINKYRIQRNFNVLRYKKNINFLFAGLIHPGKNQLEALKAANILVCDYGISNFKIYFAGDGQLDYLEMLKKFVIKKSLQKNVKFLGFVDEITKLRREMDVAIISSKKEAFGRVTVESMLAQMPVIGSNTGGTIEIIDHGKTGYLYNYGDAKNLTKYMKKLIKNRGLIKEFGLAASTFAEEKFNLKKISRQIYNIYQDLTQS